MIFVPTVNTFAAPRITPEAFVESVKKALGAKLVSAVLYGSAAAGDRLDKGSDYNVLLVVEPLGVDEMEALSSATLRWTRAKNPAPRLFTPDELKRSCDVFPIEMLDMLQSHRILAGADVLSGIEISQANLRHQVEFELRGKVLRLRDGCVAAGTSKIALIRLMIGSFSSVMSVLRAALRLYQNEVPAGKMEALAGLEKYIKYDKKPFETIHAAKSGRRCIHRSDAKLLFADYAKQLETITAAVDALAR